MPTIQDRLNLTLNPELSRALGILSRKRKLPKARIARELIERALEDDEDLALSHLANKRLKTLSTTLSADEFFARADAPK